MKYLTKNTYKIYYNDGKSFESKGNSSGNFDWCIKREFEWISWHIQKEIKAQGYEVKDVDKIEYSLELKEDTTIQMIPMGCIQIHSDD